MTLFEVSGLVLMAVALFGYINHRFLGLPVTLGNTVVGLVASLLLVLYGTIDPVFATKTRTVVENIDFAEVVFHGFLALLLFAGSLHVNVQDLRSKTFPIFMLSTVGVVVSTVVVGVVLHYGLALLGIKVGVLHCMLFGALISPTDPIAAIGVLKQAGAPKSVEMKITGESLFNDGTGVVAFLLVLGLATGTSAPSWTEVAWLLMKEVAGGITVGLVLGWVILQMLRGVDSYPVEITTTLAAVVGGYALAEHLHVSAPLTVVMLGLLVGNKGVTELMSATTREHLLSFWELLDEILNLVLFGLIGINILALSFDLSNIVTALLAVPVVLLGRWMSVVISLLFDRARSTANTAVVTVLTWGGLRGGISIALALSMPQFEGRSLLVSATYAVVLFSLLVQGTTLKRVVQRRFPASSETSAAGGVVTTTASKDVA